MAGSLFPLGFAPLDLYPLPFVSLALLFLTWLDGTPKQAALSGFAWGLGAFGVGVSWVFVAINEFGMTSAPLAALLTLLFVSAVAGHFALLGWLWRRFAPANPLALLITLPAAWAVSELFRGWFLSGFPWLTTGYAFIDTPLAGWAPIGGVYLLSWLVAMQAVALAWVWQRRRCLRESKSGLVLIAVVLVVSWLGGAALTDRHWTEVAGAPLAVTLVQGNVPQETKWDPDAIWNRLTTYRDMSAPYLGGSDLIVWPENAVTVFYYQIKEHFLDPLDAEANRVGTDIIFGLPILAEPEGYTTSMMVLGDGGQRQVYSKHHLVPFGEFLPLDSLLRGLIGFFDLPMSSFVPGAADQKPLAVAGQRAAVTICYEDAFPWETRRAIRESTLLVNGSNNAWYGDSFAPHQHLQIARMRALESGRPLARATTSGISALVDERGRLIQRSAQFQRETVSGKLTPRRGDTPYLTMGLLPWLLLWLVLWGGVTGWLRYRNR